MYGKRFVTGDRQKACLFEQKGSYMASIKDSNGQFKTLQLGTNRPVAFKQFFAAASAAGYDMRSVAKEQGVDPEVKLNREQRRKLEKGNRHMSNKAKNRKQSERLPESEMSGREAQKQPPAPQESEALCVLEHGRLTRHQTSHGRFLFTYAPADGSDEVVKSVRGRRSEIVASFNEWYAEQEKAHEESPKCPAKVSCGHEADSVSSDAKKENSVMSGKERNDTENKIDSTDETLTSKFIPDLTDPDRTLSLILITTDEESKLPVRNLKNLTKQLFGMADIYVLDWHDRALMDTYREVFLKNTPAYDYGMECSSLKIYCKPVDLTVPTENEMGMAYAKYLIDRYTRYGENRFINVLRQGICRASDRVAGDILSIADVRWLDGIDEAKRLSSRIKKLKQRVKGDSGGNETVDSLRDEISGLQKDIADWEEIASELETSNSEAAAKIDMLTRDAMRLENEKRAVERKLEMTELEQLKSKAMNGIRKALTVVPENLTQLLDLAKVLYPDRIVILPDAYRSAKKFDGILAEEWEILVAAATTL